MESPNRTNAGQLDKTTASPSPVPESEEITNKDMEEQVGVGCCCVSSSTVVSNSWLTIISSRRNRFVGRQGS